jgi:multiple sugar transport system permease protein
VGTSVTFTFIIGLGLAMLLNKVPKGKGVLSVVFIMPAMMSPAVIGRVWRCLYDYNWGLINYFLGFLALGPYNWRAGHFLALPATIFVDIWQWSPFVFLILFAGLQGVPQEPLEAARIDGASEWQIFSYITLPLLRSVILVVLLFRIIDTFRVFDVVYTLTKGGPGFSTETLSLWTFRRGYLMLEIGSAAALAYLMLVIVVVLCTNILRRLFKEVE